jgi:hypothetical protein
LRNNRPHKYLKAIPPRPQRARPDLLNHPRHHRIGPLEMAMKFIVVEHRFAA